MSMVLPSQAYELKLAPHPAPASVLRFAGRDAVSELYCYDIEFTSPMAGIPMSQVVGRPAKFTVAPVDPNLGCRPSLITRAWVSRGRVSAICFAGRSLRHDEPSHSRRP